MAKITFLESQGAKLVTCLFSMGARIFTHQTALLVARKLKIPENELNIILYRLTKKGIIKRLRRGLYVCIGLLGEITEVHSFVVSSFLINPPHEHMISHWSALQHHGLTEQIPIAVTASTTQRLSINPIVIENVSYEYTIIQAKHFYGFNKIWIDPHFQVHISDKERTILDLFVYSKMFGGFSEALGILEQALPEIDSAKLIKYTLQYDEKVLAKRLGWALEYFGISLQLLQPLLNIPMPYYCSLDSEKVSTGPCNSRWNIQNNLKSEYKK
jgi:predicted transcriptional regulator of viral defense system